MAWRSIKAKEGLVSGCLVLASLLLCEALLQIGSRVSLTVDAVTARPGQALIAKRYVVDPHTGPAGNPVFPSTTNGAIETSLVRPQRT